MDKPLISLKDYAAHRGVSVEAVKKAIVTQRLKKSVKRTPGGRFKVRSIAAADIEWDLNTDPAKQRGIDAMLHGDGAEEEGQEPSDITGITLPNRNTSLQKREYYNAKAAQLEYEQKIGKLVPRADVEQAWSKIISEVKTKLLGVPSRMKSRIPSLTAADIVVAEELIRQALESIADG